jgi:2-oxoglutarate dehydrogenase E2 component (dihydrolipoamide succinyltransferase)
MKGMLESEKDELFAEASNFLLHAESAAATAPPAATTPSVDAGPRFERVPMSPLRRTIARRLVQAQQEAAILTTFNEVDMSAVMALRKTHQEDFKKRYGIKLGFMSFFVKAAIDALKQYPAVNSEIDGTNVLYKNYYNVGVAVSGPKGLVVPVIKNADQLSFAGVELAIAELAGRARNNKLTLSDFADGTFTISNGGIFGSMMSTPILNRPQVGILGMHNIMQRPVGVNGEVVLRPMMYLAMSYDHRIIDGREAVSFLVRIKNCIESPERMLLEV